MTSELRATQEMRGRPVTYEEACRAAQRLINRAHNAPGEKSTMSIPVQASDDDVLLFDYLTETQDQLATATAALGERGLELHKAEAALAEAERDAEALAGQLRLAVPGDDYVEEDKFTEWWADTDAALAKHDRRTSLRKETETN